MLLMIGCVIFQTAVTIYLFNLNKTGDSFEKNLNLVMVVLLGHLCIKFILLAFLKNDVLYGRVATGIGLAYGPLLYIVTCSFIKKPLKRWGIMVHLLPFFLSSLIYLVLVLTSIHVVIPINFISSYTSYFQWGVAGSVAYYSFIVKRCLYLDKEHFVDDDEAFKTQWRLLNNIASILAVGILTGIFFEVTKVIAAPVKDFHLRVLPYMFFAVIPVLILKYKLQQKIAHPALTQPQLQVPNINTATVPDLALNIQVVQVPSTEIPVKRYEKSSLDAALMDDYEKQLYKYIEKSKAYLNPELSLEELAQQVKIPKHHLTQVLNERINKSFYVFVNEYRIQEAVKRLNDIKRDINILSLAFECGFNSKSSFNNYFKKVTGYTPSAYRKMAESGVAQTLPLST
jgi:AraC-like DNA-binding protein